LEGAADVSQEALAGLFGDRLHLRVGRFEFAAVVDPLLIEAGLVCCESPKDGLAGLFPGELPVGTVAAGGVRAATVRVSAAGVDVVEAALADG
jgi:hypothetical protein